MTENPYPKKSLAAAVWDLQDAWRDFIKALVKGLRK